jgi:hypothetical protein
VLAFKELEVESGRGGALQTKPDWRFQKWDLAGQFSTDKRISGTSHLILVAEG